MKLLFIQFKHYWFTNYYWEKEREYVRNNFKAKNVVIELDNTPSDHIHRKKNNF